MFKNIIRFYKMSIFDRIVSREIPAEIVYEDELCLAFRDVNPVA